MTGRNASRADHQPPGTRFAGPPSAPLLLSVIIPVYNEHNTVVEVIEDVLAVDLPGGVGLELVIAVSNSTDGTRDVVKKYEVDPRVKLVLQEHALGKGNAVRGGFHHLTGNVILIQDGDREYDVSD